MATKPVKTSIVKSKVAAGTTAPKVARARTSDTKAETTAQTMRDVIALRAYERFVARGCQHGYDVEDWLGAERELTQRT